jgi:hypothetical protein
MFWTPRPGSEAESRADQSGRARGRRCGRWDAPARRRRWHQRPGRRGDEELLRLGDLASQGVGRVALALPHESSSAHTSPPLRGGSPGSDEGGGEGGVRTRGVQEMETARSGRLETHCSSGGAGMVSRVISSMEERLDHPLRQWCLQRKEGRRSRDLLRGVPHRAKAGGRGQGTGGHCA